MKQDFENLLTEFEKAGLTPIIKDDWMGVAGPNGKSCEFISNVERETGFEIYTLMHTVNKRPIKFSFELPDDQEYFVEVVKKILEIK